MNRYIYATYINFSMSYANRLTVLLSIWVIHMKV